MNSTLSHLDEHGHARMVDVSAKAVTLRQATASGLIQMLPATLALVSSGTAPKGDVLAVARVAAIQAAKRTAEAIPLCHLLPLSGVKVQFELRQESIEVKVSVNTLANTGVEMEALHGVSVALLTLYDMLKAVDRAMVIGQIRLLEKHGGASGSFQAAP